MKKLSELGISPAPWFVDADNEIACHYISHAILPNERRMRIVVKPNYNFEDYKADSRLIAAAPDMYEALYDILPIVENRLPSRPTLDEIEAIKKAESALAKAAGEGVEV